MSARRRASTTPSPSPPSTAWLTALKPQQLKAVSWHHALLAKGTTAHLTRCIDPRKLSKADLQAHLLTNIRDIVQPTEAALQDMVIALKALTDTEVVSALASPARESRTGKRSAAPAASEAHSGGRDYPSDSEDEPQQRRLSESRVNRRASPARSPPPSSSSSLRKRRRSPSASSRDLEEDSHSADSRGDRVSDEHSSDPDTSGRSRPTAKRRRRWMACPNADCENSAKEGHVPDFCDKCGKPWGKAIAATPTTTPQKWKHLDRFVYTPLSSLASAPLRATQLASLPETLIKKAREGQQHYTIADLLCPLAHDGSFSSALIRRAYVCPRNGPAPAP